MTPYQFDLSGDHLAVNFANTVSQRHSDHPIERLVDYRSFVWFARQSGLLTAAAAARLIAWGARAPEAARRLLVDIQRLRDALYRILAAVASARPPTAADLDVLDAAAGRLRLGPDLGWHWRAGDEAPDAPLGPIVAAALALLTDRQRRPLRICGADDCLWLFLDVSKNGTRRWCDMKSCGNRMKARRFLARRARTSRRR